MAVETARKCGFRKVGGIYLCGEGQGKACGRLPFPIETCPHCGAGIKVTRGLRMIDDPSVLTSHLLKCAAKSCRGCILKNPDKIAGPIGLMGVGEKYYTPSDFAQEARKQGVSKRLFQVPKKLVLGETWVFLAHRNACIVPDDSGEDLFKTVPGVFYIFKPTRLEYISDGTDPARDEAMEKRGFTIVRVPADDPDHHKAVKDEDDQGEGGESLDPV